MYDELFAELDRLSEVFAGEPMALEALKAVRIWAWEKNFDESFERMEAEAIRDGRFLVVEVDEHGVPLDWDRDTDQGVTQGWTMAQSNAVMAFR